MLKGIQGALASRKNARSAANTPDSARALAFIESLAALTGLVQGLDRLSGGGARGEGQRLLVDELPLDRDGREDPDAAMTANQATIAAPSGRMAVTIIRAPKATMCRRRS